VLTQGHTQSKIRKQLVLLGFRSLILQLGIICLGLQLGIVCLGLQLFSSLGLVFKSFGLLDETPDLHLYVQGNAFCLTDNEAKARQPNYTSVHSLKQYNPVPVSIKGCISPETTCPVLHIIKIVEDYITQFHLPVIYQCFHRVFLVPIHTSLQHFCA